MNSVLERIRSYFSNQKVIPVEDNTFITTVDEDEDQETNIPKPKQVFIPPPLLDIEGVDYDVLNQRCEFNKALMRGYFKENKTQITKSIDMATMLGKENHLYDGRGRMMASQGIIDVLSQRKNMDDVIKYGKETLDEIEKHESRALKILFFIDNNQVQPYVPRESTTQLAFEKIQLTKSESVESDVP